MCGYQKHSFNHKLKDLYFMRWHNKKLTAVNTNLVKTQKLELQTLQWVLLLLIRHTSLLYCLSVSSLFFFIYNFILHIEYFWRLTVLTFKSAITRNYSLPRNLASTTKLYCLIYEKSELFILSDSLFWLTTDSDRVGWLDYGSTSN